METRKRSKTAVPVLLLKSDNSSDIPRITYIKGSKFTIGKAASASLIINNKNVAKFHCSLEKTGGNKWAISTKNVITSLMHNGQLVRRNDRINLSCGDELSLPGSCAGSYVTFQFLCSPDQNMQCCIDTKRPKISNSSKIINDSDLFDFNESSRITKPNTPYEETKIISETIDLNSTLSTQSNSNNTNVKIPCKKAESTYDQLNDSILIDSDFSRSSTELNNANSQVSSELPATVILSPNIQEYELEDSNVKVIYNKDFHYTLIEDDFPVTVADNEPNFKSSDLNSYNGEISTLLNPILISELESDTGDLHKCHCQSKRDLMDASVNVSDEDFNLDKKASSHLLDAEEKFREEISKHKENEEWLETRIKYLEMKMKDKMKLELELDSAKEEIEQLGSKVVELKRNLANMEIIELEYKCLQERHKYREEDRRNKDMLERKIDLLQTDIGNLEAENEKLKNNSILQEKEIEELKKKNEDLDQKLKDRSSFSNLSSCGGKDDCCEMVRAVKESLNNAVETEFKCSICDDLLIDTTVTNCSHVFCSYCLQLWMKNKGKNCFCPLCRTKLVKTLFKVPIIDEYISILTKLICSEQVQNERTKRINERRGLLSVDYR